MAQNVLDPDSILLYGWTHLLRLPNLKSAESIRTFVDFEHLLNPRHLQKRRNDIFFDT